MSSESDVGYFYILHQIEFDLEIDHDELLQSSKDHLDVLIEKWFNQRANITGERISPTESLKEGVFDWKETERSLEQE
jgi:hypothetical protein